MITSRNFKKRTMEDAKDEEDVIFVSFALGSIIFASRLHIMANKIDSEFNNINNNINLENILFNSVTNIENDNYYNPQTTEIFIEVIREYLPLTLGATILGALLPWTVYWFNED